MIVLCRSGGDKYTGAKLDCSNQAITTRKGHTLVKNLLKIEEAALAALGLYLYALLGHSWWLIIPLFFAADLSMLGYLAGPRVGAAVYNMVHHRAVAVGCYLTGALAGLPVLMLAGAVLMVHIALDRVLGYGLKLQDGFKRTHLGDI